MAGVSVGTVDRVIHNRGNVSPKSKIAVDKVLKKVDYKPNLHLSSISMKKKYHIIIVTPSHEENGYWSEICKGCLKAIDEYRNIDLCCEFMSYNQYDVYSCRELYKKVVEIAPDAVIIGPTFKDEEVTLTQALENLKIPYVYMDSSIEGTNPVANFTVEQHRCGYLAGRLLSELTPKDSELVVFQAIRIGEESAYNTIKRKEGFVDYFNGSNRVLKTAHFRVSDAVETFVLLDKFFKENPDVKGGVVLSSRVDMIADYLDHRPNLDVRLVGIDLTKKNREFLENGNVDYLLNQRPLNQGFMAVKSLMMYIAFGTINQRVNYLPLDIVAKENLEYFFGELF